MDDFDFTIRERPERRRRDDVWTKLPGRLAGAGWFLLIIVLYIVGRAKPRQSTFFDLYHGAYLRGYWDMSIFRFALPCMALAFCLGVAGIAINTLRRRRKKDYYLVSLILLNVVSLSGTIWYLVYFVF